MRVVLVDDEELAVFLLEKQLMEFENVEIVGKYTNIQLFHDELDSLDADALFMDIELGLFHGIELTTKINKLANPPLLIFVTAYSRYAVEAFEVSAFDYLLKPVEVERLKKTIDKLQNEMVKRELLINRKKEESEEERKLHIHSLGKFALTDSKGQQVKWRTKKVKEMFAYLWHHRNSRVHKAAIIEELWPQHPYDKANSIFHTTMYQLRKILKEIGYADAIFYNNDDYSLLIPHTSDLEQLLEYFQIKVPTKAVVQQILATYTGDYFCEDGYIWAVYNQYRYKKMLTEYLEGFVKGLQQEEAENEFIETCLNRMLLLDECNEEYTYMLLKYFKDNNNPVKFLLEYNRYEQLMKEEFGLALPKRILHLYYNFITNNLK